MKGVAKLKALMNLSLVSSDQNQMQILSCDPRILCRPCDYTSGDQFVSTDSNSNCKEPNYCPTDQCYAPQMIENFGPSNCDPQCYPCQPTQYLCNPCEPLGPRKMPGDQRCQPRFPCLPCSPICKPFSRKRYVQPSRRESCKPVFRYQRPCVPMATDTIYKKSFDLIDAKTAASCRLPPAIPNGQLKGNCGEFAKETVTKVTLIDLNFKYISLENLTK